MAGSAVIGALRVTLGINTAAFDKGLDLARRNMVRTGKDLDKIGQKMQGIGRSMATSITLPVLAAGAGVLKLASNFESSMNRVEAATGAAGKELKALRDQAKAFGADKRFTATATEAANVMEMLAKNGLNTSQILNGAAESVMLMSAATGGDFARSADLASDIVVQFGRRANELPGIVNKITGSLLASKFGFEDYQAAIGQAGGVAGGLGISFEDLNAALTATSALFASGSDAGTSFKTYLTTLRGKSDEAKGAMAKLGLEFFDAEGRMKPLSEQAQILQDRMGGLADQAKTEALTTIFGTDAMRTAIGLMNQGADGMARITEQINKASAQQQMEARMKGLAGGIVQLKKAFESLSIALGDSGFLGWSARVIEAVTDMIRAFASLPPSVLKIIAIIAGVAAVAGPLIFVVGKLVSTWGTLLTLLGRFSPAWAPVIAGLKASATGSTALAVALGRLRSAVALLLGPIGLLVALFVAVGAASVRAATASAEYRARQEQLAKVQAKNAEITQLLATATGEARKQALANASAARAEAIEHLKNAKAKLASAMAARALAQSRAADAWQKMQQDISTKGASHSVTAIGGARVSAAQRQFEQADANAKAAIETLRGYTEEVDKLTGAINAPLNFAPILGGAGDNPSFDKPDSGGTDRKSRDRDLARRREEIRLQHMLDVATTRGDIEEQRRIEQIIELKRREQEYEDAGLDAANARIAAARDMREVQDAILAAERQELDIFKDETDLRIAELNGDRIHVELIERRREKQQRILEYRRLGLDLAKAEQQAEIDMLDIETARAEQRARMNAERERDRELRLAELRGDSEAAIREIERRNEIERRTRDYYESGLASNEGAARERATRELDEEERARLQGDFRQTFRDGVRAALDGDLKSFVKDWWKDRLTRSLEDALNSVADLLHKLVQGAFSGAGNNGGGGLGGALGSLLGSIISGGTRVGDASTIRIGGGFDQYAPVPHGFKNGGSFKVGGRGGPDANLISFRATKGEMVDIRKPGSANDNGRAFRFYVEPSDLFKVQVQEVASATVAHAAPQIVEGAKSATIDEIGRQRLG